MCVHKERKRLIIRNWFMLLWRLTSPRIYKLKAPKEVMVQFCSKCHQARNPMRVDVLVHLREGKKNWFPSSRNASRKSFPLTLRRTSPFVLYRLLFYFILFYFILFYFILYRLSTDQIRPTHIRKANLRYSVYQVKC